ncbi:hypothetical protein D3C77_322490 [compost metagenome]
MRVLQQSRTEGVANGTGLIPKHARQQTNDTIDHDHRRKLPARQHVIADRQLIRDKMFPDSLVIPLIMAAYEDQMLLLGQFLRFALREAFALRTHQDNTRGWRIGRLDR